MGRYPGGWRVWISLCVAALAAGGAFSILFTGETIDGLDGGFGNHSLVTITGGHALWAMLFAALAAVLVGSAGRYRFVLVFPVAILYTMLAVYGLPPFAPRSGLDTYIERWREWFIRIGTDVYQAAETMYAQPIPYDLQPGLLVILIPLVIIVGAFAVSATLYEESPVISVAVLGLTIGVLSTISFEDGAGPFFAVFLVSAVALLLFSGSADARGVGGKVMGPGIFAGVAVVALVLALPKAPLSHETFSQGLIDWTRIGAGGTSRLDVQADVGDYLTYGRDAKLMKIQSTEPLYWRGGTLDHFDGVRWSDTTQPGQDYGEEVSADVPTRLVPQTVQVMDARTDRIFGGYRIVQSSLDPYDARQNSDGSWTVKRPLAEGSEYRVLSEVPQPTEAQLRYSGEDYPASVTQKFLQLPGDSPEVIAKTADKIQRRYSPRTPYAKARDIERYMLYDGGFVYNLDVSYKRADRAIEEFLSEDGDKEGFCTQFATSMALIAREMGVPSRVVYGATTGDEVRKGEYVVTGANMHTWVEIYFPGVGWYPFDPTPGFTVPSAMQVNAPRPQIPVSRQDVGPDNPAFRQIQKDAGKQPAEAQKPPEEKKKTAASRKEGSSPVWPVYALLPVLLIAAVPLTKRALVARGRPEDFYQDLLGRLRDLLPPGRGAIAGSPALTPTERILLLAGAVGVEEEPLRDFAGAYSEHLYSAAGITGSSRRVSSSYRRARRALEALPRWRRLLGEINPASLAARAGYGLAAAKVRFGKSLRGKLRRRR